MPYGRETYSDIVVDGMDMVSTSFMVALYIGVRVQTISYYTYTNKGPRYPGSTQLHQLEYNKWNSDEDFSPVILIKGWLIAEGR